MRSAHVLSPAERDVLGALDAFTDGIERWM